MLEPSRASLETCVYCPKLCRAACPVSNVEHTETVTPWGKMSLAYFAARGDVPLDVDHGSPAWACTSCFGCREMCDHKNPVATTLLDARAALFLEGAAPSAARSSAGRFKARAEEAARVWDRMGARDRARTRVLVGCGYGKRAPDVAEAAIRAASILAGEEVSPVRACCGLPLLHAGDRAGFVAAARAFAAEIEDASNVIAVDPGCASALITHYPHVGVNVRTPALLVDLAASSLHRLQRLSDLPSVRWIDPCQLGRGLGRFDEPRRVLDRITGKPPGELPRSRERGECSGGGGLLPVTRPEASRAIADARIAEHAAAGGGLLVTGCASSLHRLRSRGADVTDLTALIARALTP